MNNPGCAKTFDKASSCLRGQSDFGNEHEGLFPLLQRVFNDAQINLSLAATRHTVKRMYPELVEVSCDGSNGRGLFRSRFDIGRADSVGCSFDLRNDRASFLKFPEQRKRSPQLSSFVGGDWTCTRKRFPQSTLSRCSIERRRS